MQSREIESGALIPSSSRDDELRQFEIRQLRERAYNSISYRDTAFATLRASILPTTTSMLACGLGGLSLPIYLAASGQVSRRDMQHIGTVMEGGMMLGMGAGAAIGLPATAAIAGISGGAILATQRTISSSLRQAHELSAASGPISASDKVTKKDVLLNKLISEINAINDMPSLIEKAKEICENDAETLRTERGVYSYSFFKKYVGNKLGHEQGNTKSWNAIKDALEKRSFILSVSDNIDKAFKPIALLLKQVEKGQSPSSGMRPS